MHQSWLSQSLSSAFLEAFRRCAPETEAIESGHFMAFPAVVCAAFSAEVGLKTMLEHHGVSAKGHDLRTLFMKLPEEQQYAVFEATGMGMQEFSVHLAHSKLAFVEWRYIYEGDKERFVNLRFLGAFAAAIEAVALKVQSEP